MTGAPDQDRGGTVVLLTARDPLSAGDGAHALRTARHLAGSQAHEVVLVLLEDAVGLARPGHRDAPELTAAREAGVRVLVEEDARARRAVSTGSPGAEGIEPTSFAAVVDLIAAPQTRRTVWL